MKVKNGQITLKYMTSGIFGKKIDVVLQYENGQIKEVKHVEYKNQKRLKSGPDLEFKSHQGHEKSVDVEGKFQKFNSKNNIVTNDILNDDLTNPFYIGEGKERRLNLSAIGGEALQHTHDFIKKNYDQILSAANKYYATRN